jgi:cell division protease FtsH
MKIRANQYKNSLGILYILNNMNIFRLMLMLGYATHGAYAWFFASHPVVHIQCNKVTTELMTMYPNPFYYGEYLNYQDVNRYINHNNITCATVYTNMDEIAIIDKSHVDDIGPLQLHIMKTTPHLTEMMIDLFQYNGLPLEISTIQIGSGSNFPTILRIVLYAYYILILVRIVRWFRSLYQTPSLFENSNEQSVKHTAVADNDYKPHTTFDDVAGCDEAKYELTEIVDFLKHPLRYKHAGAKVPAGVLLEGPPGTGKTLLAKATAGEAGVSFIPASGSDFVEIYVGVGASRVRSLFEVAKSKKPCIIFIDEIDAIGQQRAGFGGNSERDQTLNQLLTNMDGFETIDGIIVMAATNRSDILDRALTRPGRFDRKITVGVPDRDGRKQILAVHLKNKNVCAEVNFDMLYDLTSGFTGAELANLVNESAILSVRYNSTLINDKCFMDAFEKVTIGLPKIKENRDKESLKLVAYHEGGHAITAMFFQDIFDVRRVTINANNAGAGGYTLFTPKEQYVSLPSKRYMLANMIVALGGRAAEIILYTNRQAKRMDTYDDNLIFEGETDLDVTAGASNDLKQANSLARNYVSVFGLGSDIGLYDADASYGASKTSEETKGKIDVEVKDLVNYALKCALLILRKNKDGLKRLYKLLITHKIVNTEQLKKNIHVNIE